MSRNVEVIENEEKIVAFQLQQIQNLLHDFLKVFQMDHQPSGMKELRMVSW